MAWKRINSTEEFVSQKTGTQKKMIKFPRESASRDSDLRFHLAQKWVRVWQLTAQWIEHGHFSTLSVAVSSRRVNCLRAFGTVCNAMRMPCSSHPPGC